MIPYGKQSINKADKKAVLSVLGDDFLTQGPRVLQFESALARYCGVKYVVVFANGTAALHGACAVAGLKSGDEAITSAISFAASANCVLYQGARVKFADVDFKSAQVTASTLQKHITKKTKVLIPVDLTGRPTDLPAIQKLAKKNKLKIILDAAHSLGASYKVGSKVYKSGSCSHCDMTILSFHPVKSITTGEGGAVTTNDPKLYKKLIQFRQHGITKNAQEFVNKEFAKSEWYYEMQSLGYNYRLTDLQCALGLSQLKRLDQFILARRKVAATYRKKLNGVVQFLSGDDDLFQSAHHIIPALVDPKKREAIFKKLRAAGIVVHLHYLPIYRMPFYEKNFPVSHKDYPGAEAYFRSAITLPIFPDLKKSDQDFVIKTLKKLV